MMRATVLSDNIESGELRGEWGLSVLIEHDGRSILLDAGASGLFAENAGKLGLSLDRVEYAVLSHAHFDHADGIPAFFRVNSRAKFFLRNGCGEDCWKHNPPASSAGGAAGTPGEAKPEWEYIGLPAGLLQDHADRIELVEGVHELCEGVFLLPHTAPGLEQVGLREQMFRKVGDEWVPDDFSHEQSLVFDTPQGLVVFNSCSHAGADVIIGEVAEVFPGRRVLAFVGGFHLFNKSEEAVRRFARQLRELGVSRICTGHCTGDEACRILREELGECLTQFKAGLVMEFDTGL